MVIDMKDPFVWLVNTLALASGMWIIAPEVIDKFGALKQIGRHFCKLCPDWLPS
jgi:hypothetical protein